MSLDYQTSVVMSACQDIADVLEGRPQTDVMTIMTMAVAAALGSVELKEGKTREEALQLFMTQVRRLIPAVQGLSS